MANVLKVLKVLNFSGDGEGNIFKLTFTFIGAAAPWLVPERPSPQPYEYPHPNAATPRPKGTRHPVPGPVRRERGTGSGWSCE